MAAAVGPGRCAAFAWQRLAILLVRFSVATALVINAGPRQRAFGVAAASWLAGIVRKVAVEALIAAVVASAARLAGVVDGRKSIG